MSIAAGGSAEEHWDDLLAEHEPALRRFIGKRMANRHLVDDALQETYLRALRSSHSPDGRWLRALARRASVDVYRREPPPGPSVDPLSPTADRAVPDRTDMPGSDEHVAAMASRQAVRWAFGRLSPRHRRLLVLRGVHELSYEEIAHLEDVTVEALTSALNRARERLRSGIEQFESRGRGMAAAVGGGSLLRRLRQVAGGGGPAPLIELAGTTLTAGLVVLAAHAPASLRPSLAAATQASHSAADPGAPAATPRPTSLDAAVAASDGRGSARQARPTTATPSASSGARGGVALSVEERRQVNVSRDETVVRVHVDSATVTGTSTARTTVEVYCSRSVLLAGVCPAFDRHGTGNHTNASNP